MFENYVGARAQKRRKWVGLTVSISVAAHAIVGAGLIVRSFWVIEKIPVPGTQAALGAPPPPPPPPPPAGKKKQSNDNKKKLKKVKETVQPNKDKPDPQEVEVVESDTEGVEGGVEGGQVGGVVGGVLGGVEGGVLGGVGNAPPPPPPASEPKTVPQVKLEAKRIAGEKNIKPPDAVKLQIRRDGKSRVVAVIKMCLTPGGSVKSLRTITSSGYPGYDRKIKAKMRGWRYRPFKVNGKPVPVCGAVTFIYTMSG